MDKVDKLLLLRDKLEELQKELKNFKLEIVSIGAYRHYHLAENFMLVGEEDLSDNEGFAIVFKDWREK